MQPAALVISTCTRDGTWKRGTGKTSLRGRPILLQKAEAGAPRFGRVAVQKFLALAPAVPSGAHTAEHRRSAGVEACLTRAMWTSLPEAGSWKPEAGSRSSGPLRSSLCESLSYPALLSAFSEITQYNDQNQGICTDPALSLQPTDLNQVSPGQLLMCYRAKQASLGTLFILGLPQSAAVPQRFLFCRDLDCW